jgi:hypothetical protein
VARCRHRLARLADAQEGQLLDRLAVDRVGQGDPEILVLQQLADRRIVDVGLVERKRSLASWIASAPVAKTVVSASTSEANIVAEVQRFATGGSLVQECMPIPPVHRNVAAP